MANSLLRRYNFDRSKLSAFVHCTRLLSSDSLVEFKPGEVGLASGIPEEHLNRRVCISNGEISCCLFCLVLDILDEILLNSSSVVWLILKNLRELNMTVRLE